MPTDRRQPSDPVERLVFDALTRAGYIFVMDGEGETPWARGHDTCNLDFYVPELDTYIECCQFYTARKIEQASRVRNLILIQGMAAARGFAQLIDRAR